MDIKNKRIEVMRFLGQKIDTIISDFLKCIDTNWQPTDFLPLSTAENFTEEIKELRLQCKELPYDYLVVLIGDVITEEALPTYG
jgi:acyl-[acyl-carrier-protein] desaturase